MFRGLTLLAAIVALRHAAALAADVGPAAADLLPATTALFIECADLSDASDIFICSTMSTFGRRSGNASELQARPVVAMDASSRGAVLLVPRPSNDGRPICVLWEQLARTVGGIGRALGGCEVPENRTPARRDYSPVVQLRAGRNSMVRGSARCGLVRGREFAAEIVDRMRNPAQENSLNGVVDFQRAWEALPDRRAIAAWAVPDALGWQSARLPWSLAPRLPGGDSDQIVRDLRVASELIVQVSPGAPRFMAAALRLDTHPPEVSIVLPDSAKQLATALRLLSALERAGPAPRPLLPRQTLLACTTAGDKEIARPPSELLLDGDAFTETAQASPQLVLLIRAVVFAAQTAQQMEPGLQVIVARSRYSGSENGASPSRVPAVAVVFAPKEPRKMRLAYQLAFIGGVNQLSQVLQQQGGPRLSLRNRRVGAGQMTSALPIAGTSTGQLAALTEGFSPTIATLEKRFLFATSVDLAERCAELAAEEPFDWAEAPLRIDFGLTAAAQFALDGYQSFVRSRRRSESTSLGSMADLAVTAARIGLALAPAPMAAIELPTFRAPLRLNVVTIDEQR